MPWRARSKRTAAQAIGIAADVANTDQVDAMVEEAVKRFGRLDILINNAGRVRPWLRRAT